MNTQNIQRAQLIKGLENVIHPPYYLDKWVWRHLILNFNDCVHRNCVHRDCVKTVYAVEKPNLNKVVIVMCPRKSQQSFVSLLHETKLTRD